MMLLSLDTGVINYNKDPLDYDLVPELSILT
jgi:hypothetical protein